MSDYGIFEADAVAQAEPRRQARTAAVKLSAAIHEVRDLYGPFLFASSGKDEFDDRWHYSKADIRATVNTHIPPVTGIMRRVHEALRREFAAELDPDRRDDDDETVEDKAEDRKDDDRTINDRQYDKVKDNDKNVEDEVESNSGDGSDAQGDHPDTTEEDRKKDQKKDSRRRRAGLDGDEPALKPAGDFDRYLDHVDEGGPEKVEAHDFGDSDDTGSDKSGGHEAKRIAVDLYEDWAKSNGMRVASLGTLEHYADTGIDDPTYFLLAGLIRQADDDCDCEDSDGEDRKGPPPPPHDGDGSEDSDGDDPGQDGSDSGDDAEGDSDGDSGDPDSDSGDSDESSDGPPDGAGGDDSGDPDSEDASGGDNPFGGDSADAGPLDGPPDPAGPPDAGDDSSNDFSEPTGPPDLGDGGPPDAGGDPASGDQFTVPDQPPDLAPDTMDQIPPDDTSGDASIPPEVIDQILGLPEGTVESLVVQELMGSDPGADQGGPPPGPPQQQMANLRRIRRRAAEDPSEGNDPDDGGQAVAPAGAETSGGPTPDGVAPDNGALLDQAGAAITQLVDQKTQEYQRVIDPLTQAQQAIQYAQEVEQAANPLDVTPPEGTVDVMPSPEQPTPPGQQPVGAGPEAGPPPPGTPPAPPGAPPAPMPPQPQQQVAYRIATAYGVTHSGYQKILAAMSRKHYQHVAEAIQSLPPEHRVGIASSLADMFKADNVRFNHGQFLASSGVDPQLVMANLRRRQAAWDQNACALCGTDIEGDPSNPHAGFMDRGGNMHGSDGHRHMMPDRNMPSTWHDPNSMAHNGSRHPFADPRSARGGERRANEDSNWTATTAPEVGTFKFNKGGQDSSSDNIAVDNLPNLKGSPPTKTSAPLGEKFQNFENTRSKGGLATGGDTDVDAFLEGHPSVGQRGNNMLHQQQGLAPHTEPITSRRTAGFFEPKVAGWDWNDHLNGYVTDSHRPFRCTTAGCDTDIPTPSQTTCRCGRLWYTYAIGEQQHLAAGGAQMYLAREIPVRENVIMANRQFAAEDRSQEYNYGGDGGDYADEVEFHDDHELHNPDVHAPGETDVPGAVTGARYATDYGPDDHNVVYRDGQAYCSQCDAMLWDPNVHHCPAKQAMLMANWDQYNNFAKATIPTSPHQADWTKYDDTSNAGYAAGPSAPPQTGMGNIPSDWARRGPEKGPAGQYAPTTFQGK